MILQFISLASLLIIITMLRRIVDVMPSVLTCIWRWKECINIDSDIKTGRDRDFTALALILPFCLTASNTGILSFLFMNDMGPEAAFGVTVAIFAAYMLFRLFTSKVFLPQKSRRDNRVTDNSDRTFFIILSISVLACHWIMGLMNADVTATRSTILWLSAIIYGLYIVRKFQIFQSSHSIFTSFLYLCALEIIPTGTLAVSVIIF